MPRKRVSVKDQARRELAVRLRWPVADILDREEAAAFLGHKSKSSLSNLGSNGPGFYRAPIGGKDGYVLYRRDWLKDYADGKSFVAGEQPWPPPRQQAPYASTEELLDKLVTEDGYKKKVLTGW